MNGTLRQYLTERKYSIPSDQTYSHIEEWLDCFLFEFLINQASLQLYPIIFEYFFLPWK